jgi:hypothetical protein
MCGRKGGIQGGDEVTDIAGKHNDAAGTSQGHVFTVSRQRYQLPSRVLHLFRT